MNLNATQSRVLEFIDEWIKEFGEVPSYDLMLDHCAISKRETLYVALAFLRNRGFISWHERRPTEITVLRLEGEGATSCQ